MYVSHGFGNLRKRGRQRRFPTGCRKRESRPWVPGRFSSPTLLLAHTPGGWAGLLRTRYVSRHGSVWPCLQSAGECGEKDSPAAPDEWGVQGTKNVSPCLGFACQIETGAAELIRVFLNQNWPPHGRPGRRPSTINNSQLDGGQLWSPLSEQLADTCIPYEVAFSLPRVKWS